MGYEKDHLMTTSTDIEETNITMDKLKIQPEISRFPYCVVWTPIPMLTWLIPIIGHMGICMSSGIIRDFAGPYYVSEDNMGFGEPTKYWQLSERKASKMSWDQAVLEASEEYKSRMHNLCCDNCHSHVAMALNLMNYGGSTSWNMINVWFLMLIHGRYISFVSFLKTWLPFLVISAIIITVVLVTR